MTDFAIKPCHATEGSTRKPPPPKATHPKPVEQIDLITGKVVAVYSSQSQAERALNISSGNISAVCRGKRDNAYGYFWRFNGAVCFICGQEICAHKDVLLSYARWFEANICQHKYDPIPSLSDVPRSYRCRVKLCHTTTGSDKQPPLVVGAAASASTHSRRLPQGGAHGGEEGDDSDSSRGF
jgi:hypothetical protein